MIRQSWARASTRLEWLEPLNFRLFPSLHLGILIVVQARRDVTSVPLFIVNCIHLSLARSKLREIPGIICQLILEHRCSKAEALKKDQSQTVLNYLTIILLHLALVTIKLHRDGSSLSLKISVECKQNFCIRWNLVWSYQPREPVNVCH